MENIKFILMSNGRKVLWKDGYRYNKIKTNKGGTEIWRCSGYMCSGSITWCVTDGTVTREGDHQCIPNMSQYKLEVIMEGLKKAVCDDYRPIPKVFDEFMRSYRSDPEYDDVIPSFEAVKDTLYRIRKKYYRVHRCTFKQLQDVIIPQRLAQDFLLFMDGASDKIIAFCSMEARHSMANISHYFGDGTFKAVPKPFSQLYTIHGDIGSDGSCTKIIPLIFALLPDKQQATYIRFFHLVKQHLPNMTPSIFQSDYELAAMNAFVTVYPAADIKGCHFHFAQALRRKAKKMKITEVGNGEQILSLFTALAHLPVTHIPEAFLTIDFEVKENTAIWDEFINYFVKQWMNRDILPVISCYGNRHRTINACEGWHNRINRTVGRGRPSLYFLISCLRKESIDFDFRIRQNNIYVTFNRKRQKKMKIIDERLTKITNDYLENSITLKECLERLSKVKKVLLQKLRSNVRLVIRITRNLSFKSFA